MMYSFIAQGHHYNIIRVDSLAQIVIGLLGHPVNSDPFEDVYQT